MQELKEIINAYFAGSKLSEKELSAVHDCRKECIAKAWKPNLTLPGTSFEHSFDCVIKFAKEHYSLEIHLQQLRGRKAIELGPGLKPMDIWLKENGIAEYVGVEPFHHELAEEALKKSRAFSSEKARIVSCMESLEHLLRQPDESAIIVSRGVLCPELYGWNNDRYYRFIAKEIYRVTPSGAPTIHVMGPIGHDDFMLWFRQAGFKPLYDSPTNGIWLKQG